MNCDWRQRAACDVINVVPEDEFADEKLRYLQCNIDTVYKAVKYPTNIATSEDKLTKNKLLTQNTTQFQEEIRKTSLSQRSRKEFFCTIRKQYSFPATDTGQKKADPTDYRETSDEVQTDDAAFLTNTIKSRKRRLHDLRKLQPKNMDFPTRVQWIRLELLEMREQDKGLYLQLAKLDASIKEVQQQLKIKEENPNEDVDDVDFCRWPRSTSSSELSDLLSSDGAKELKHIKPLKRGLSLQLHSRPARRQFQTKLSTINSTD